MEKIHVLEMNDDLQVDTFLILCLRDKGRIYTWKGFEFEEEKQLVRFFFFNFEKSIEEFMANSIENYFGSSNTDNLEFIDEQPHNESDDFLAHF